MIWNRKEINLIIGKKNVNIKVNPTGASIDSRTIRKGNIFFAIKGKFFNGSSFIEKAIKKGASICFAEKISKSKKFHKKKIIIVTRVENIINQFAIFRRNSIKGEILGITGSVGKTSIKEFISSKLSFIGKTFVSFVNFNNYYGTLLSIINCPKCIDFCVLELGMSKKGEILHLSYLSKPQVTLISNVNSAHNNAFFSIKNIVYAKIEILFSIRRGNISILNNCSNYLYLQYIKAKKIFLNIFILSKCNNINSNCSICKIKKYNRRNTFLVFFFYKYYSYKTKKELNLKLVISFNFLFIFIFLLNIYIFFIKYKIKIPTEIKGRGNKIIFKNIKNKIIDESYNSSPTSLLYMINKNLEKKRLILFIGDMKEFGENEKILHKNLNICRIDKIFPVGILIKYFAINIEKIFKGRVNISTIVSFKEIVNYIKRGDIFYYKSSSIIKIYEIMKKVIKVLKKI